MNSVSDSSYVFIKHYIFCCFYTTQKWSLSLKTALSRQHCQLISFRFHTDPENLTCEELEKWADPCVCLGERSMQCLCERSISQAGSNQSCERVKHSHMSENGERIFSAPATLKRVEVLWVLEEGGEYWQKLCYFLVMKAINKQINRHVVLNV